MTQKKYKKYFLENPWGIQLPFSEPGSPKYIGIGQEARVEGWDEPLTQVLRPIYKPFRMINKAHLHTSSEILYFIGGDPMNFEEFGAEVEFTIGEGEERETYVINKTTWVYVPAGVMHCPLDFKRVDKPIMFGHIMFTPTYKASSDGKTFSSIPE